MEPSQILSKMLIGVLTMTFLCNLNTCEAIQCPLCSQLEESETTGYVQNKCYNDTADSQKTEAQSVLPSTIDCPSACLSFNATNANGNVFHAIKACPDKFTNCLKNLSEKVNASEPRSSCFTGNVTHMEKCFEQSIKSNQDFLSLWQAKVFEFELVAHGNWTGNNYYQDDTTFKFCEEAPKQKEKSGSSSLRAIGVVVMMVFGAMKILV